MEELDLKELGKLKSDERKLKIVICLLSYPKHDQSLALNRLSFLSKIGVEKLFLIGNTIVCGVKILGKGTNSIVVKCMFNGKDAVIKVLRTDANRQTLELEANILRSIEHLNIAPKLYSYCDWYLIEEYVHGSSFLNYTNNLLRKEPREVYFIIKDILCKALLLDKYGVDHGELFIPKKHIIITPNNGAVFIDFESASRSRKPKNFTSVIQYLMNNDLWRPYLFNLLKINTKDELLPILREYKKNRDVDKIMFSLGLFCD